MSPRTPGSAACGVSSSIGKDSTSVGPDSPIHLSCSALISEASTRATLISHPSGMPRYAR